MNDQNDRLETGGMSYKNTAYEYAKAQGWTAKQVESANRRQVALACGIDLDKAMLDPDFPPTFLVWNIKKQVAKKLRADASVAIAETRRAAILTKVRQIAEMSRGDVDYVSAGETITGPCWVVRRAE